MNEFRDGKGVVKMRNQPGRNELKHATNSCQISVTN